MRSAWLLLSLLLLFSGCSAGPSRAAPAGAQPTDSAMPTRTLDVGGRARTYQLYVPPRPSADYRYPLVLAFHGAGSSIESLARASGFNARATRDGVLVVYPQGLGARFDTRPGSQDVAFTRALIEELDRSLGIDRARIHATGFSNGGFLCYRLAADLPGVFAGIAPVAGLLADGGLPAAPLRTSLLHVHGSADRVVSAQGRAGSVGAREGVHLWAARAGCAEADDLVPAPAALPLRARLLRHACPQGVEVALIWMEGVGHAWPQDAHGWLSGEIWSFFRRTRV
jgi:polyhydroxybutyrate depolymerase